MVQIINKIEKKHAYIIIAHNNFNQLKLLLKLLDDSRNDIYLHIGKDVHNVDFTQFNSICMHSRLYFPTKRIRGSWGGKSLIKITLLLLKQALNTEEYTYLHLLSGMDLPIKTQDYIHNFFEQNNGIEYININLAKEREIERVKYYHIFTHLFLFKNKYGMLVQKIINNTHTFLDNTSVKIQRLFHINRLTKSNIIVYLGSQWFSITHNCAKFLVENETQINKLIQHSFCADEVFVQTIIMNSPIKKELKFSVNGDNLRYIDWERGKPYVFRKTDFNELLLSDKLFARKFDEYIDMEIIKSIYSHLKYIPKF